MPRVPRASIAEAPARVGEPAATVASSATALEEPETRDWYDADAVTFATAAGSDVPTWYRAWPPETRSLETHVRELVVAAQSARR